MIPTSRYRDIGMRGYRPVAQPQQTPDNSAPSLCHSRYADEALRRQPWCSICASTADLEAHHVIWLERGGADTLANLAVLCATHHALVHSDPSWDRRVHDRFFGVRSPLCAGLLDGAL